MPYCDKPLNFLTIQATSLSTYHENVINASLLLKDLLWLCHGYYRDCVKWNWKKKNKKDSNFLNIKIMLTIREKEWNSFFGIYCEIFSDWEATSLSTCAKDNLESHFKFSTLALSFSTFCEKPLTANLPRDKLGAMGGHFNALLWQTVKFSNHSNKVIQERSHFTVNVPWKCNQRIAPINKKKPCFCIKIFITIWIKF